jgi:hypothetical protein
MLFTSICCPPRTSRHGACHARRRCDGPGERVAFRVRTCMPSNADIRRPPKYRRPPVTLRARHRTARTGTRRDGHAPENARTDAHDMSCVCRYAPAARLVLRAARHVDCFRHRGRPGGCLSKRDVSRDTGRSCVQPRCFLTPSSTE